MDNLHSNPESLRFTHHGSDTDTDPDPISSMCTHHGSNPSKVIKELTDCYLASEKAEEEKRLKKEKYKVTKFDLAMQGIIIALNVATLVLKVRKYYQDKED